MPLDRQADSLPVWLIVAGLAFWLVPIALRGWRVRDLRDYRNGE